MSLSQILKSLSNILNERSEIYILSHGELETLLEKTSIFVMESFMKNAMQCDQSTIEIHPDQKEQVKQIISKYISELTEPFLLNLDTDDDDFEYDQSPSITYDPDAFPLLKMAPTRTKDLKIAKRHDTVIVNSVSGRFNAKHTQVWKEMESDPNGKYRQLFNHIYAIDKSPLCRVDSHKQVTFFVSKRWKNTPERIEQILTELLGIE